MEITSDSSRTRLQCRQTFRSPLLIILGVLHLLLSLGMFVAAVMIGKFVPEILFFWGFIGCSLIFLSEAVMTIKGGSNTVKYEKALKTSSLLSIFGIGSSMAGLVFALGAISWAPWDCKANFNDTCVPKISLWPFHLPPYATDDCKSRCFDGYTIWYLSLAGTSVVCGLISFIHFNIAFCYDKNRQDFFMVEEEEQRPGPRGISYHRLH